MRNFLPAGSGGADKFIRRSESSARFADPSFCTAVSGIISLSSDTIPSIPSETLRRRFRPLRPRLRRRSGIRGSGYDRGVIAGRSSGADRRPDGGTCRPASAVSRAFAKEQRQDMCFFFVPPGARSDQLCTGRPGTPFPSYGEQMICVINRFPSTYSFTCTRNCEASYRTPFHILSSASSGISSLTT